MSSHVGQRWGCRMAAGAAALLACNAPTALAFTHHTSPRTFGFAPSASHHASSAFGPATSPCRTARQQPCAPLFAEVKFEKIDENDDQVMAFMDVDGESGIDCYVDSYATVDGVEYTIGSPCDYAVALCYFEEDEQLIPIELDDPLMDDIFPIAEAIIEDEFQDELVLLRTPQTLTLVGELEENEDEADDEDAYDDDLGDEINDTEEEVEILVSFEEDGQEYHLVRLLDPVLLVGKAGNENTRILLAPEESDKVMPLLEDMFMSYSDDGDSMM